MKKDFESYSKQDTLPQAAHAELKTLDCKIKPRKPYENNYRVDHVMEYRVFHLPPREQAIFDRILGPKATIMCVCFASLFASVIFLAFVLLLFHLCAGLSLYHHKPRPRTCKR